MLSVRAYCPTKRCRAMSAGSFKAIYIRCCVCPITTKPVRWRKKIKKMCGGIFLGEEKKHSLKKIFVGLLCAFFKSVFFVRWLFLLQCFRFFPKASSAWRCKWLLNLQRLIQVRWELIIL